MRSRAFGLLSCAAALALPVAPAMAAPIKVTSLNSFAIKTSDLPVGCSVERPYDKGYALVTCETQEQFTAGFAVAASMTTACAPKQEKYVCEVKE
jgi:hypothetical protein